MAEALDQSESGRCTRGTFGADETAEAILAGNGGESHLEAICSGRCRRVVQQVGGYGGEPCVFLGSRAIVTVDEAGGESDWEFASGMDSLGMSSESLDDGDDETRDEEEYEIEDCGAEE